MGEHKLLFSFNMCVKLMQGSGKINDAEFRFLLTGATGSDCPIANPASEWLVEKNWLDIIYLAKLKAFKGLAESFVEKHEAFRRVFDASSPHLEPVPEEWSNWNIMQKMLLVRCLRLDKVSEAVLLFVQEEMGKSFVDPPAFDLGSAHADSPSAQPLLFVLSSGADPMSKLLALSEKMSIPLKAISLGQGQGPHAQKLIADGVEKGFWVLLQNCHLSVSWMPALEQICEELDPDKVHKDFRLWLTSMPSPAFPVAVLQNSVKMTNEPPKGLRANLNQAYYKLDDDYLDSTDKPAAFKRLFFGLAMLHAVVIERKKFGPLGWNIPYAFNETDLDISSEQLKLYLDMYDEIPYSVLDLLTQFINYGGRVTDDKDLRTIDIIMRNYYTPKLFEAGYKFSESGTYVSFDFDEDQPHQSYIEHIKGLPIIPAPEAFGMHENADITCAQNELYGMFDTILKVQSGGGSSGGGQSREAFIGEAAKQIEDQMPLLYDEEATQMKFPVDYHESMNTFLCQEQIKFNRLLRVVKRTLFQVQRALKGLVVMSAELEQVAESIFNQWIPDVWETVAYPSLKPLTPWVADLLQRLSFIQGWCDDGTPAAFWISSFFFPQAFLTGTLQNYARKHSYPIDTIEFGFRYLDDRQADGSDTTERAEDGAYVYGLFMEGARWNSETHMIGDSLPKELFCSMPLMPLDPVKDRPDATGGIYRCPVYKELRRAGLLSTTGHSTNFVTWIEIPTDTETCWRKTLVSETNAQRLYADSAKWIKAGVACFCALRY